MGTIHSWERERALRQAAVRGILDWAATCFPERRADPDEPFDGVERRGHIVRADFLFAELTECPGFACPLTSDACDTCKFGGKKPEPLVTKEELTVQYLIDKFMKKKLSEPEPSVRQTRHEAWYDLFASASNSRGGRAASELRESRRMGL